MELRTLHYFSIVAQEENITKAANRLHLTQPTLSRTLRDLERELGKTLFLRSKRGITLTDDGRLLQSRAQEILFLVNRTEKELKDNQEITGDIYMAAGETDILRDIALMMTELRLIYPHLRLRTFSGDTPFVLEEIDKGLVDFGLIFEMPKEDKYNILPLKRKETWGIIMRIDSELAGKDVLTPEDLMNESLILSEQSIRNGTIEKWFHRDLANLTITGTYTLVNSGIKMVMGGMGYALTYKDIAPINPDELIFRPLSPQLAEPSYLIWKKYRYLSAPARLFLQEFKKRLKVNE
jgi:DNA-binding transcriptional LysR family regulator